MNRKILIIATIALFLDQISKAVVEMFLKLKEEVVVIQNIFSLHYINNYGAAWNILDNKIPVIIILSIFSLILIYHFMYVFQENARNNIAFGLVIGGLCGNLIDRWLFGYVRDFLDFQVFKYDYPVFNIADVAIVIGISLLIIAIIKGEDRHETLDCNRK